MTTAPRRHKTIRINCKNCGIEFDTLVARQAKGQGNFCSMPCYREYYKANPTIYKYTGKKSACIFFDEKRKCRMVYWFDAGTNKRHNSTYAKWWWELNMGEVPSGYVVTGNNESGDDEFALMLRSVLSRKYGKMLVGRQFSDETKQKMSASGKVKIISDEHKTHIGDGLRKSWGKGKFDLVHVGSNSSKWRGGKTLEKYPKDFSNELKAFIKDRDNYICQICSRDVYRSRHGHIHHINGNKADNNLDNLILLCSSCHSKIHAGDKLSPVLQAFRDKLYE